MKDVKVHALLRLVVALLCLLPFWLDGPAAASGAETMPAFALPDLGSGVGTIGSEDFQGTVVLVNFWATWCPPCRREIPSLVKIQDQYGDKGVVVLGISLDKGDRDKVAAFIKKIGVNYPVALGDTEIARKFGALGAIPFTFLVDRQGRIVNKYPGYTTYESLRDSVEALLAADKAP
ncbi:MAG: TlpA family protein disulfide reductase [Desulfobulbaceae bacterium]|nr:MAG: TlpA family protein disulfide reductase [Desulfobulbaceae bacterium]